MKDRLMPSRFVPTMLLALSTLLLPVTAQAQDGRPGPSAPESLAQRQAADAELIPPNPQAWQNNRPPAAPGLVRLGFDDVSIKDTFPFIAQMTGKVVIPVGASRLNALKITLMSDSPIERGEALDMLIQAFRLNSIGFIEKEDVVIIGGIDEIVTARILPVLTANDEIRDRRDKGSLVWKFFQLNEVPAEEVGERIGEDLPPFARITVDPNSNQIAVLGDIALCQHLEAIIQELDRIHVRPKTQTFRLAYADATEVSDQIEDLYSDDGTATSGVRQNTRQARTNRGRQVQGQQSQGSTPGPQIPLRVTVSVQQNSLTVSADPVVVDEIGGLIENEWDLPRSPGTSRIYELVYTDPMQVAEKLNSLLGQGGGATGRTTSTRQGGGGGGGSVDTILQGIYRIEPFPDSNELIVFCKTEQSLDFLDEVIAAIDQPSMVGLPFVIELKHANAVELTEELNVLLAEAGSGGTLERGETGLNISRSEEGDITAGEGGQAGTINFPWQRGGGQNENQSNETPLIGKVRIVPIVRQNALAILCPAPFREQVQLLIERFDRPGRQVMISAVIAEVELTDDLNLGLRFSNSDEILGGGNPDNRVGAVFDGSGTENDFFNIFDSSVLDMNLGLNVVLQALAQKTNVRILQEPIIFTADNQEAIFFDGQDIPFITNTTINAQGNPTDSFEYREVGVTLNVRPRITVERDVDLEILLELSSIVPGQTLFGGAIVDRRQTRTHVIVENEQTIVISGLMREAESKITRKIPLLGDIPILGELFTSRENQTTSTELLAFITPNVVDNPTENDTNINEDFRDRIGELGRPLEDQKWNRQNNPKSTQEIFQRRHPDIRFAPAREDKE